MEANAYSTYSSSSSSAAAVKRPNVGTLRARRFLPYVLQTTLAAQSANPITSLLPTDNLRFCLLAAAPSNADGVLPAIG